MFIFIFWLSFFSVFLYSPTHAAAIPDHSYPKLANYFLHWDLTEAKARELAKWHLVILDMEVQARHPDLLRNMRQWNPNIVILAYITPQEIQQNAASGGSVLRRKLIGGIPNEWYITNSAGVRQNWWPGTFLLNVTEQCPAMNGMRWQDYLVNFVVRDVLSTGMWDGVFYDNAWDSLTFFQGKNIDLNRDGAPDANIDAEWQAGMRYIYRRTRELTGDRYSIVANGTTKAYASDVNGMMLENFIPEAWSGTMGAYLHGSRLGISPRISIINANTRNSGGQDMYAMMRFGLGSALMLDGYYSFDYGDKDHGQLWQYDEYAVNLGKPIGESQASNGASAYAPDVWQRQYEHGLSIVNSTREEKTIDLGADYEKIRGVQDPVTNDGSIVSEVTIPASDGLILLRTFETLDDVPVPNGSFVRFFHADGSRARNGFFLFDDAHAPGENIAHIDLNNNGARDLVVVSGNRLSAWRDDGQPFIRVYPYTANYTGELMVAIGDITGDGKKEIIVAPSPGIAAPIKVYGWDGTTLKDDWYPFGARYKAGYSLATGHVLDAAKKHIIVGTGKGAAPAVGIFTSAFARVRQWLPFGSSFRGGVSVAAGDVLGDETDEVIVGAGSGKKPVIRIFTGKGARIGKEITPYKANGSPGISVQTKDVDFDGKDEIIAISKDAGN